MVAYKTSAKMFYSSDVLYDISTWKILKSIDDNLLKSKIICFWDEKFTDNKQFNTNIFPA